MEATIRGKKKPSRFRKKSSEDGADIRKDVSTPGNTSIKDSGSLPRDTFYVLTNSRKQLGAGAMFYDNVLHDFAERIGEGFFIIPSSIHEVLLLPAEPEFMASELREMLIDVNRSLLMINTDVLNSCGLKPF